MPLSNEEHISGILNSNSSALQSLEERVKWLEHELCSIKYKDCNGIVDLKYKKYLREFKGFGKKEG